MIPKSVNPKAKEAKEVEAVEADVDTVAVKQHMSAFDVKTKKAAVAEASSKHTMSAEAKSWFPCRFPLTNTAKSSVHADKMVKVPSLFNIEPIWASLTRSQPPIKDKLCDNGTGSLLWRRQNVTAAKHLPSRVHVATTDLCDRNKPVDLGNEVVKRLGLNFDLARLTLHSSLYAKGRKCLLAVDSMKHKKKKPKTVQKTLKVAARTRTSLKAAYTSMIRRANERKCNRVSKPWSNDFRLDRQSLAKLQMWHEIRMVNGNPMYKYLAEDTGKHKQRTRIAEDERKAQDHINAREHPTHKPTLTRTAIVTSFVIAHTITEEKIREDASRKIAGRALVEVTPPKALKRQGKETQVVSSQHNLLPLFLSLNSTTPLLHITSGGF